MKAVGAAAMAVPFLGKTIEAAEMAPGLNKAEIDEITKTIARFHDQSPADYADIVGRVEQIRTGRFAEPLREALKRWPALTRKISESDNPRIAAYEVGKTWQLAKRDNRI